MNGAHADWVYKRLEAASDAVVDFRFEETGKTVRNMMRIRTMRNVPYDSDWHQLKLTENFEVTIEK